MAFKEGDRIGPFGRILEVTRVEQNGRVLTGLVIDEHAVRRECNEDYSLVNPEGEVVKVGLTYEQAKNVLQYGQRSRGELKIVRMGELESFV